MTRLLALTVLCALLAPGCAVGPAYKRPAVNAPAAFRNSEEETNSLGDLRWWQLFQDPVLKSIIQTALTNNYDLRIATTRVEQSRALLAQTRSAFYPQVGYQAGVGAGRVLSSLAMAWSARLPEADLMSWGWRVPFVASALLVGVGWFIRVRVAESPVFEKMKATGRHVKTPLFEVLRHHPRTTLLVIGARLAEVTWFYTVVTFSLAYASNQLALPKSMVLTAIGAGGATEMCTIPLLGLFADRIGQKWLYALGTVGLIAFALPFFRLLEARNTVSVWLAIVPALAVVGALMYGQQATLFAAQFPAEVRYSGISLGVQVSGAIGGGLAPIVATGLLAIHGGSTVYVSLYLMALGAVALACVLKMRGRAYDAVEGTCSTS